MESLLKTQETSESGGEAPSTEDSEWSTNFGPDGPTEEDSTPMQTLDPGIDPFQQQFQVFENLEASQDHAIGLPDVKSFSWEMLVLGIDEPLPLQEVLDDL